MQKTHPYTRANALFAPHIRLEDGWHRNALLAWDEHGTLTEISTGVDPAQQAKARAVPHAAGPVIAGMPNLHSHAFQSAMAGLTEYRAQAADSFWSWRDLMYRFAARISPDTIAAIAHWLYIDMLKAGYTAVCEFHYVHHQPDGTPYAQNAEMARRVTDAAQQSGIGLTMLPVLYQYSNFGAQAPRDDQRRFLNSPEQLLALLDQLRSTHPESNQRRYGVAPHSLRAVSADSLHRLLNGLDRDFPGAPVHIHIAEQTAEVDACLVMHGTRPVQWLLDHAPVDGRWCLVHATHMDEAEIQGAARSGAVAGLCLTTEANLGDGIFPSVEFLAAGGRFGVGSDSHISVDWRAELRLLEYGQRLWRRERNVLASPDQPIVAERLFDAALAGGAQASGRRIGRLAPGCQADFLVLDADHPQMAEQPVNAWLSGLVFSERGSSPIRDVYVGGRQVIRDGRHADEEAVFARYRRALSELLKQE
jgi:formimidoylglutamate deiminase